MPGEPMAEWIQRLDEPQEFYARMAARRKEDPLAERYERIADRLVERDRMIESLLASDKALVDYVRAHPARTRILKRVRRELKAKRGLVRRLAEDQGKASEILGQRLDKRAEVPDLHSLAERLCRWRPNGSALGIIRSPASDSQMAKGVGRNGDSETIALYWALAMQNLVKIHPVLPEIPENLSLCGYQKLFAYHQKDVMALQEAASQVDRPEDLPRDLREQLDRLERLHRQWIHKQHELHVRWLAITGRRLDFTNLPWLRDFGQWKAPVPSRLGWSNELYSLEARRMGHQPALAHDTSGASNPGDPTAGSQTSDAEAAPLADAGDAGQADEACEIERLYELAGGRLPRQPSDDDKLYTFPGTLNRHENIFYDYSIIIPIECVDSTCMEKTEGPDPRDLTPAKVLAGKAKYVLEFLRNAGLSDVLGEYSGQEVVDHIEGLLDDVLGLDSPAVLALDAEENVSLIRHAKRRLKKMAGLMRLISRTEILLRLGGKNPKEYVEALRKAIGAMPRFDRKNTQMPTTNENKPLQNMTLYFPDVNDAYYDRENRFYTTEEGKHCINVPDAYWYDAHPEDPGSSGGWEWWVAYEQRHDLRNYVIWLGEVFHDLLKNLVDSAEDMRDAVDEFSGNYAGLQGEFEQLAAGTVNRACFALSDLLDEIAEQITLPMETRGEGSIRLGLQVVFRQTWFPVAYVMGKLVGYKNLIPNQKETLHRRTFVKTVTETTTAEEFATARQDDYSHSQKETSEVVREASRDFSFTQNVSGHYDVKIWGVEAETQMNLGLEDKSQTVQNLVSESVAKGSAKFSEKREVKIRELAEAEDVQEVASELQNLNQEITANYFYYQLLREYRVTVALEDLRPVLLRTRDVPSPTEIDDKFLSAYAHILLHHLPSQLATDAQESADQLDILARTLIRRRAEMDQRSADLELLRSEEVDTTDTAAVNQHREELLSKERLLSEAREAFVTAEEEYTRIKAKMDRVLKHLRENICHYMQFIWHESPQVDQDMLLREEWFCGSRLPDVTRGLLRQGYYGNEEIFDYTGPSSELFEAVLLNLRPGDEIVYGLMDFVGEEPLQTGAAGEQQLAHHYIYCVEGEEGLSFSANATVEGEPAEEGVDYIVNYLQGTITFLNPLDDADPGPTVSYVTYEDLAETSLYQYLARYYAAEDMEALLDRICGLAFAEDPAYPFIEDPASPEEYLTTRNVQIPQDALVVETMPGQVPLLEGFQMAHRMLDVQKACLENRHLAARIEDRPWGTAGEDTYTVERIEGTPKETAE